ncbi:MAG: hypothetical protein QW660_05490 [Candidatus Bathyarchaeia archaeon]
MKKCIIMSTLFFLWMIATVHNVNAGNGARNSAIIIPPAETFSFSSHLNESSGIHISFYAINGTVNFLFSAPDGKALFALNNTCNGTVNFEAPKAGTYALRLSNPSKEYAVLVELNYSVKSWHCISVWTFTLNIDLPLTHFLRRILSAILAVIGYLSDILKELLDAKILVLKKLVSYKSPELPIRSSLIERKVC